MRALYIGPRPLTVLSIYVLELDEGGLAMRVVVTVSLFLTAVLLVRFVVLALPLLHRYLDESLGVKVFL